MYTLSPEVVNSTLVGRTAQSNGVAEGSISVMLIQDVPAELRDKLQLIN